jgi:FkbM family methyltransferase
MMNQFKEWMKRKLRKGLAIPDIENDIRKLRQEFLEEFENVKPYGVDFWYKENLWEPSVQLALKDLCHYGSIAFDVGANLGGLSIVMSRCVGAIGIVCSFEASRRIIDKCQRNLVWNGCNNVQVYNAAIYHTSNQMLPIYEGNHLNDSVYSQYTQGTIGNYVMSLALDDFVRQTGIAPDLIKMDIEGAEYDALMGMRSTIQSTKPHLILETQVDDTRCLDYLHQQGYISIDLNSYKIIDTQADYPDGVSIRNNLYIHEDRLSKTPYDLPFNTIIYANISENDFKQNSQSSKFALKSPVLLERGRYIIDVNFTAKGVDNELICGLKSNQELLLRYHGYSRLLAENYRDWVIHISEPKSVDIYFDFLNNTSDSTFFIKSVKIHKITNFT